MHDIKLPGNKKKENGSICHPARNNIWLLLLFVVCLTGSLAACARGWTAGKERQPREDRADHGQENGIQSGENETEQTEITVFLAASLQHAMTELAERFCDTRPGVRISFNADSSGKLLTQIREGFVCDLFFSAAERQMDELEAEGLVVEGSRKNVLGNQLVLVTSKDSGSTVRGLSDLGKAQTVALAGPGVPAGRYTRQALVNLGIVEEAGDVSAISTSRISRAFGGVIISEQENVSRVMMAVLRGDCEVGTVYLSDIYGYEDQIRILEKADQKLTGDIIYPVCLVKNSGADDRQQKAARDFLQYILSEEAGNIFQQYGFGILMR